MKPLRAFFATFALGLALLSASHMVMFAEPVPEVQRGPIPAGVAIAQAARALDSAAAVAQHRRF